MTCRHFWCILLVTETDPDIVGVGTTKVMNSKRQGSLGGYLGGWLHQIRSIPFLRATQLLVPQLCYGPPLLIPLSQEPRGEKQKGKEEEEREGKKNEKKDISAFSFERFFSFAAPKPRSCLDTHYMSQDSVPGLAET